MRIKNTMTISKEKETQYNNYFEYRKVDSLMYEKTTIPLWISKEIKNKSLKILDYGCGFGQYMNAFLSNGYKNIFGVDIEHSVIKYCLKEGFNVKELDLNNLSNPFNMKFDIIIISHVIEHITKNEIINTLSLIRDKFLSNQGKLLIAVPNAQSNTNSYWAYEDWTHTTLFTSGSIYYVLRAAGFNVVKFLDVDCTLGNPKLIVLIRKLLLKVYKVNMTFWNKVTGSSYHKPSPQIFSFEIKVKALSK